MNMTKYDGIVTHIGMTTAKAKRVLKRWVVLPKNNLGRRGLTFSFCLVSLGKLPSRRCFLVYTMLADGQVVGHISEMSTVDICTGKHF